MTSEERAELEASAKETGSAFWSQGFWTFAFASGTMIAVLYAGWLLVSWLLRSTLNVTWTTLVDPWVLPVVAFGSVGFAAILFVGVFRRIRKLHPRLRSDIEGGVVFENRYEFVEAKRFQEPEHGGLIYFLRTTDDKVLVLYDEESQELGVHGKDPLSSRFRAKSELVIVRAPQSQVTLAKRFSGAPLQVSAPAELRLPPAKWPENEEMCSVPWAELDSYLAAT